MLLHQNYASIMCPPLVTGYVPQGGSPPPPGYFLQPMFWQERQRLMVVAKIVNFRLDPKTETPSAETPGKRLYTTSVENSRGEAIATLGQKSSWYRNK